MNRTFAYSFDRETFFGSFESRAQAFEAAVKRAEEQNNTADQVYVGLRVPADPQATNHAAEVIKNMRKRAKAAFGDDAAEYLANLSKDQQRDLDGALETTISRWLANYRLMPTFSRIEAISEHPIPLATTKVSTDRDREVHDLGQSE